MFLKVANLANYLISSRTFCSKVSSKSTVFSGIQPTGSVHLGNYFGAIKVWTDLQMDPNNHCIFSVVDLHSITHRPQREELSNNTWTMVASLLACGIDPEKSIFFLQSNLYHHSYIAWILNSFISPARLSNVPQFKEKSRNLSEVPLSLLSYPVLQAADILLYKAHKVPVGEDQRPHLYITRDIVNKFNLLYGPLFPMPEMITSQNRLAHRVKSLRHPNLKMSKSEPSKRGRVDIFDPPEVISANIKQAVTDTIGAVTFDPENRPGVSNLISIHSLCTDKMPLEICEEFSSVQTGAYKEYLAELVIEYFKPFRLKYVQIIQDKSFLIDILCKGSQKASKIADLTLTEVCARIGLQHRVKDLS